MPRSLQLSGKPGRTSSFRNRYSEHNRPERRTNCQSPALKTSRSFPDAPAISRGRRLTWASTSRKDGRSISLCSPPASRRTPRRRAASGALRSAGAASRSVSASASACQANGWCASPRETFHVFARYALADLTADPPKPLVGCLHAASPVCLDWEAGCGVNSFGVHAPGIRAIRIRRGLPGPDVTPPSYPP